MKNPGCRTLDQAWWLQKPYPTVPLSDQSPPYWQTKLVQFVPWLTPAFFKVSVDKRIAARGVLSS